MSNPQTQYIVSFDCEFTGPLLMHHAMVNLGAVFMNVSECKTLLKFKCYINVPPNRTWDPRTVDNFWRKSEERLKVMNIIDRFEGVEIIEAMHSFVRFVEECRRIAGGSPIYFVTNRADIDVGWVDMYLSIAGYLPLRYFAGNWDYEESNEYRRIPDCRRVLDANSFYQGICGMTHEQVDEFNDTHLGRFNYGVAASKKLGLKRRPTVQITHDATDDAEHVGQVHCYILNKLKSLFIKTEKTTQDHTPQKQKVDSKNLLKNETSDSKFPLGVKCPPENQTSASLN